MSKFLVLHLGIFLANMAYVDGFLATICKPRFLPLKLSISQRVRPIYGVTMTLSQNPVDETTPLEHRGVPTEHQGLHSALYADGDDHGATDQSTTDLVLIDVSLPVSKFLDLSKGKKAAGVFSISGSDGLVKFVGFSRNLHTSLSGSA